MKVYENKMKIFNLSSELKQALKISLLKSQEFNKTLTRIRMDLELKSLSYLTRFEVQLMRQDLMRLVKDSLTL